MKHKKHFLSLICLMVFVMAFWMQPDITKASDTVTAVYNFNDGAQKISNSQTAKYNFTMTKKGYATIKANGKMKIKLYQDNGICLYESDDIIAEASDFGATFSLTKGKYYALVQHADNTKDTISVKGSISYKEKELTSKATTCYAMPGQEYYFKVNVKEAGVIKITSTHSAVKDDADVYLCDSKKKEISKKTYGSVDSQLSVYTFGVTKGTYYIKLSDASSCKFSLKYNLISVADKKGKPLRGGDSKEKAKAVKLGKNVNGLFLTADKTSKEQWYKIEVNTKKEVIVTITGNVSVSGDFLDKQQICCVIKGPSIVTQEYYINSADFKTESNFKLSEGTYYICATKVGDKTSGNYSISMK